MFEVDTGDDGHILDTTPQEIELKAGDGIRELVFFNDRLPGIHLIKVDSADLSKPIANAKFRIEAVDHSFGPEEFTTGMDGAIDLSKLPTGAYVVTELECPGYVIDDAQRIIQLEELPFWPSGSPGHKSRANLRILWAASSIYTHFPLRTALRLILPDYLFSLVFSVLESIRLSDHTVLFSVPFFHYITSFLM